MEVKHVFVNHKLFCSFYISITSLLILFGLRLPRQMNFRKISERGGVISDPKNFVAVFSVILRGKTMIFWEIWVGSLQSEKFVAKKRNIVFRNEGG